MSRPRVVITGMGVLAPNAHGLSDYEQALRSGRSGIRRLERLAELGFGCQVGGVPQDVERLLAEYLAQEERVGGLDSAVVYASIAGLDCWRDAGLPRTDPRAEAVDWETGALIGTGSGGLETVADRLVPFVSAGRIRRLGSRIVENFMASNVSAKVGGLLGLGNWVSSNASACTTGTEAVIKALDHIRAGRAQRMLAGGAEGSSPHMWAGFDGMRLLTREGNAQPEAASRPLSGSASGFVPGSGAGILLLESLASARARGARIHAEVLGGCLNSGGQRGGGTMTAPNPEGVRRCIRGALQDAGISGGAVDAINGHLTATFADPYEVHNWSQALERPPAEFPPINATKSLIGHGLGAAGGLECIASVLQLERGFVHGSLNCEDLHPELAPYAESIPHRTIPAPDLRVIAKASFGFGDVNGCVIFRRWDPDERGTDE